MIALLGSIPRTTFAKLTSFFVIESLPSLDLANGTLEI